MAVSTLLSVSPATGPTAGGDVGRLTGMGFAAETYEVRSEHTRPLRHCAMHQNQKPVHPTPAPRDHRTLSASAKGKKVGLFVLVIGLGLFVGGVVLGLRVTRISGWPTAQARVVERGVGKPEQVTGGTRKARYVPNVRYTFEVDGKSYEGQQISPVEEAMTADNAQSAANAFPDTVEIHYDPSDPSEAYIETGSMTMAIIVGVVGLLLALGALGALLGGKGGAG